MTGTKFLLIPEHDPRDAKPYPGHLTPGWYTRNQVASLLRAHRDHPEVVQFIADMLED